MDTPAWGQSQICGALAVREVLPPGAFFEPSQDPVSCIPAAELFRKNAKRYTSHFLLLHECFDSFPDAQGQFDQLLCPFWSVYGDLGCREEGKC